MNNKDFQGNWEKWKEMNNKLWEDSTNIKNNENLKNVKAFMSYILNDNKINPMSESTIRDFNKKLGNEKMELQGSSLKYNNEEREYNNAELKLYSFNFLSLNLSEKTNARKQLGFYKYEDLPELSSLQGTQENKGYLYIENNSLYVNIEKISKLLKSNNKIVDNMKKIYKEAFGNKKVSFRIQTCSLKGYLINIFLYNSNKDVLNSSFELSENNDLMKKMWINSYYPYIKKNLEKVTEKTREELKKELSQKIIDENSNITFTGIEKILDKEINEIALSKLTYYWIEKNKNSIKYLLNTVDFYKNNKTRQKEFLKFFKETVKEKKLSYYSSTGNYPETFGGDFGEIDTLIRPKTVLKERGINNNIQIKVLGKSLSDDSKQVPADGKITFVYEGNKYTCTFQSKLFSKSSYNSGIYSKANFVLGYKHNITDNQHKTNLYSYEEKDLNEWGYLTIGDEIKNNNSEVDEEKNYLGALPGLLRIKTFVSSVEELNRSDFYYFSGYYIPSYFLLTKIKDNLKEWKYKQTPLKVEKNKNLIYGNVGEWNVYNFLKKIINYQS